MDLFSIVRDPTHCSTHVLAKHFILLNSRFHELSVESKNTRIRVRMGKLWQSEFAGVTPRIPVRPDWRIRTGFQDARLRTGTHYLIFFFFFKTELIPVGMAHILKQNPNIIYKSKNYHRSGVHQILDTYN